MSACQNPYRGWHRVWPHGSRDNLSLAQGNKRGWTESCRCMKHRRRIQDTQRDNQRGDKGAMPCIAMVGDPWSAMERKHICCTAEPLSALTHALAQPDAGSPALRCPGYRRRKACSSTSNTDTLGCWLRRRSGTTPRQRGSRLSSPQPPPTSSTTRRRLASRGAWSGTLETACTRMRRRLFPRPETSCSRMSDVRPSVAQSCQASTLVQTPYLSCRLWSPSSVQSRR